MNDNDTAVTDAEQAFYEAFVKCDIEAMKQVWADDDDTACVHPGGTLLRGRTAILQSWAEIFSGATPPQIQHRELHRWTSGGLAIHIVEELIRPSASSDPPTKVIAMNVYRQTAQGWRMLAHHASLPLVRQGRAARGPLH